MTKRIPIISMKTEKKIRILQIELMKILSSDDNPYYGLSLENLVTKD